MFLAQQTTSVSKDVALKLSKYVVMAPPIVHLISVTQLPVSMALAPICQTAIRACSRAGVTNGVGSDHLWNVGLC